MKKLTSEEVLARIDEVWRGRIEVLEKDNLSVSSYAKIKCLTCGLISEPRVTMLIYKDRWSCRICKKNAEAMYRKTRFYELRGEFLEIDEPSGEMGDWKGQTRVKCKICGHRWKTSTGRLLDRSAVVPGATGCPNCAKNAMTKTHEQFVSELNEILPDVIILDKYVNNYTPIRVQNSKCGHQWSIKPVSLISGGNDCGVCARRRRFMKTVEERSPTIEVLSDFYDTRLKVDARCKICGYEWSVVAESLACGNHGCPKCAIRRNSEKQRKFTPDEFLKEMLEKRPEWIPTSQYDGGGAHKQMVFKCAKCGTEHVTDPLRMLSNGCGCPSCGDAKSILFDGFDENGAFVRYSDIELVNGHPKNKTDLITVRCKRCDTSWDTTVRRIINSVGRCPHCKSSRGERRIAEVLKKASVEYYRQYRFEDCKDDRVLPFDFYIPSENICIEFDGEQHYTPIDYFGGQRKYDDRARKDKIKNTYCAEKGIRLLRIPYTEYNSIFEILTENIDAMKGGGAA